MSANKRDWRREAERLAYFGASGREEMRVNIERALRSAYEAGLNDAEAALSDFKSQGFCFGQDAQEHLRRKRGDAAATAKPWGSQPGDAEDPNHGRICVLCKAPIRAMERHTHVCRTPDDASRERRRWEICEDIHDAAAGDNSRDLAEAILRAIETADDWKKR